MPFRPPDSFRQLVGFWLPMAPADQFAGRIRRVVTSEDRSRCGRGGSCPCG